MIDVTCSCGTVLRAQDRHAGRVARCPNCAARVPIPGGADEAVLEDVSETVAPALSVKALLGLLIAVLALAAAGTFFVPSLARSLGFLIFVIPGAVALVGILLAALGLGDVRGTLPQRGGKAFAVLGLASGALALLLLVPLFFASRGYETAGQKEEDDRKVALKKADDERALANNKQTSANNMHNIIVAMHAYYDDHKRLPPAVVYDPKGKPLYSWRVLLLPYIEENALYEEFKLDEPWDSPNNIRLLKRMPEVFRSPGRKQGSSTTPYQVWYSKPSDPDKWSPGAAVFEAELTGRKPLEPLSPFHIANSRGVVELGDWGPPMTFQKITDGASNTMFLAEAAEEIPWTKPGGLFFDPAGPLPKLGNLCADHFLAAYGDGRVAWERKSLTDATLRALITYAAGDRPGPDWGE
jgi:hypothetical protein